MEKEKLEKEFKKEFFKRYKSISSAVLAMIWVDIQEFLDKQKSEIKEMMNKKFKELIEELEIDTETLKYILKQIK